MLSLMRSNWKHNRGDVLGEAKSHLRAKELLRQKNTMCERWHGHSLRRRHTACDRVHATINPHAFIQEVEE